MTDEFGTEVNGEYCTGLVINAETLVNAKNSMFGDMDPYSVTVRQQKGGYFMPATEYDADLSDIDNGVS